MPFDFRTRNILGGDFDESPNLIRRNTQFGDGFNQAMRYMEPEDNRTGFQRFLDQYGGMYEDGPAMRNYTQHMQNVPTREDFKPGWLNRITSAMGGFSAGLKDAGEGIQTALFMRDTPYRNALEDFQIQGKGLADLADNEVRGQSYKQKMMDAYLDFQHQQDQLGETRRLHDAQIQNYDSLRKQRESPNFSGSFVDANGNRIVYDPRNPQQSMNFGSTFDKTQQDALTGYRNTMTRLAGQRNDISRDNLQQRKSEFDWRKVNPFPTRSQHYTSNGEREGLRKSAALQVASKYPGWSEFIDEKTGAIDTSMSTQPGYSEFLKTVERRMKELQKGDDSFLFPPEVEEIDLADLPD